MILAVAVVLPGCADYSQSAVTCVQECHTYGFWGGLWHGWIAPWDFIGSLIWPDDVTVWAQDNNGAWYSFGFLWGAGIIFGTSVSGGKRIRKVAKRK